MEDQEEMTAKEAIQGVRALNEMMAMFKGSGIKVGTLMPDFIKTAEGDYAAWFTGIGKVSDLDVDDAQGCLIIALTMLGQIKVKIRNTPAEAIVHDIFQAKTE